MNTRQILNNALLWTVAAAMAVTGCTREQIEPGGKPYEGEPVSVQLSLQLGAPENPVSEVKSYGAETPGGVTGAKASAAGRVIASERTAGMLIELIEEPEKPATRALDDSQIANFWVFQYDGKGDDAPLVRKDYYTSYTAGGAFELYLGASQRIAVVANTFNAAFGDDQQVGTSTYRTLLDKTSAVTSSASLLTNGGNNMPVSGSVVVGVMPGAQVNVPLKRNIAQVVFRTKLGNAVADIWMIRMRNVPDAGYWMPHTEEAVFPIDATTTDYASEALDGLNSSTYVEKSWFAPVNRRGVVAGTTGKTRVANAPGKATYVQITGITSDAVTNYTIHLGADFAEDYNINPNYEYTYQVTLYTDPDGNDDRVDVALAEPLTADANGVLTVDGKMLFFKFGGAIGFTQEGAWGADKVLFNPSKRPMSDFVSYGAVPSTFDNWSHSGTNVKNNGTGNPCRLVGLSASQIHNMTESEINAYNSGWRLPTADENTNLLAGYTGENNWVASSSFTGYYSGGSAGAYFPGKSTPTTFLPAAGRRLYYGEGNPSNIGGGGFYWAGTNGNWDNPATVEFNGTSGGKATGRNTYGYGVRCVRIPTLKVDQNGILTDGENMLFFQFGSVVGFTQEGDWGADKILFNPVTGSPDYSTYGNIPVYSYDAGILNISASNYHNGANIKAGKGDPCKLVGLTAKQIQSMTEADLDAYNSGWRLPTKDENVAFVGGNSIFDIWVNSESQFDNVYYSGGSAGGWFPNKTAADKVFLPAAGSRFTNGSGDVGSGGFYWCSETYNSSNGYSLGFSNSIVDPLNRGRYASGFGARCVKTNP